MNIAQLSEQLKDVPQGRLIDYAKNPNSVVPQFLALAEIQRRQQLSAQAQPPASTVANDVLAQAQPAPQMMAPQGIAAAQPQQMAQQLPENQPGVAQLPSRVAPQGFADGGIVAFADGGLSDEEDEDREMASLFPRDSGRSFTDMLAAIPGGIRSLVDKLPKSYEETKLKQATMEPNTKGGHKYEAAVLEEAKRQGVDPALALHVLYKETGNLKDPETARSKAGAIGVMQLMPKTAAGLGVNPENPMENIRGGISYLKQMADKYKENRLAAAAYNAGPGNLDKALRRQGGLDTLPHETRNYIAGLAQGGSVEKYADGGYTGYFDAPEYDSSVSTTDVLGKAFGSPIERLRNAIMGVGPRTSQEIAQSLAKPAETKPIPAPLRNDNLTPKQTVTTPPVVEYKPDAFANAPEKPVEVPKSKADLYAEALEKDIEAQAAKAAKSGDMNLALSIMQAGLGMLASKSPYGLTGIGEGAQQGVSTFAALKKQESDQAKDLMAARLGLYKYGAAAEGAAETREQNKILRQAALGQKESEAEDRASDRAFLRYGTRVKQIEDSIKKDYLSNPMYGLNPEKFAAEIQAKIAQAKASDSLLNALAKRAGVGDVVAAPVGPVIVQTPKGAVSFPSQEAADEFKRKAGIK